MKIRDVKQLPADFSPPNTSPQLNGPYPGRNATRGYLVGESELGEFAGDEAEFATTTAPAAVDDPERMVGVLMFGRFGKTDPWARTAWAALQRELPQEYPNQDAAAARVAEIAKHGGAIVTEKPRPEAERLVKRFQSYGLKSRIVDDNLREQTSSPGRRMPRIGDTLQWRTMKDTTTRTGTVLDIKGFDTTVQPKRLPGETAYPRPVGINLANKQLTYRVIPAEQSMTQPGGWIPQTPLESSGYNPLDDERRQQRAQDRERKQFKRDELEFELGGEETHSGPAYYVKINDRDAMRDQQGQPRRFPSYNAAAQMATRYKMKYPDRKAEVVNIFFDEPVTESRDPTYEDVLSSLKKKLGDYLQDVVTAVKKDSDLLDKVPDTAQQIHAVKTLRTDDGHEIKIHGNEDDGFRISISNRDIKSRFRDLDEAVMACEMYCARRRQTLQNADYLDEA